CCAAARCSRPGRSRTSSPRGTCPAASASSWRSSTASQDGQRVHAKLRSGSRTRSRSVTEQASPETPANTGTPLRAGSEAAMSPLVGTILLLVFIALVVLVISRSIRIVPQATAGIVERFGRYHRTLNAGLNMVTPFVDRLRPLIDLREQVV